MSDTTSTAPQSAEAADPNTSYDLRAALQAEYDRQAADAPSDDVGETDTTTRDDGRDEKGRFAPKEKADGDARPDPERSDPVDQPNAGSGQGDGSSAPKDPEENAAASPPPGWSVASKAAWNELPEAVRADIAKREREVDDGFKQYSGMKEIRPYAEHFAGQGNTLKGALDSYMGFEKALGQNFAGGIDLLCRQYGVDPRALAQHILGGQQTPQTQRDPNADRIAQLERYIQSQEQQRVQVQQSEAQQSLEQFARDPKHTYFENVKPTMGHLIQAGQAASLEDAYEKAIWMHPEIRPLLLKQQQAEAASANQAAQRQAAATQARQSAKSLTGSPAPGGSSADRSRPMSIREAAEEAARAQGVSL